MYAYHVHVHVAHVHVAAEGQGIYPIYTLYVTAIPGCARPIL